MDMIQLWSSAAQKINLNYQWNTKSQGSLLIIVLSAKISFNYSPFSSSLQFITTVTIAGYVHFSSWELIPLLICEQLALIASREVDSKLILHWSGVVTQRYLPWISDPKTWMKLWWLRIFNWWSWEILN